MGSTVKTIAFQGVDVCPVEVQVQIANGMPAFTIVGLPDKAVAESRERVRSALHAMGISLPPKRLTVNLAPADVMKEGSHYDLPIALGVLAAMDIIPAEELADAIVLGELSLDASIRSVAGVLPAAIHANANDNKLICPADCGGEAAWAGEMEILAPNHILQFLNHIKGTQIMVNPTPKKAAEESGFIQDMAAVKGQESAKRALEIAAAGGHNVLMVGPPGSGKSMLASCLPGILPPLSAQEALEVSMIHSLSGTLPGGGLMTTRPYRDPHHSASLPALVGGGHKVRPGEISLAHHGVLFLDELPEFSRSTLEAMRQPLETGETLIARANMHVKYPARFQLIAAMNPCRCGYLGDPGRECTKAPKCGTDYQAKLSGPLLDRIDLHVDVPPVSVGDLHSASGEPSSVIAARVKAVRLQQEKRAKSMNLRQKNGLSAAIGVQDLEKIAVLDDKAQSMLSAAMEKMQLSARSYHRLLRVARTIADMDGAASQNIQSVHLAEALSYKQNLM